MLELFQCSAPPRQGSMSWFTTCRGNIDLLIKTALFWREKKSKTKGAHLCMYIKRYSTSSNIPHRLQLNALVHGRPAHLLVGPHGKGEGLLCTLLYIASNPDKRPGFEANCYSPCLSSLLLCFSAACKDLIFDVSTNAPG